MNTSATLADTAITLTDAAAIRVGEILASESEGTVLRISVEGGGCSGFQYSYTLVRNEPEPGDLVLQKHEATVLIDELSQSFMKDAVIDFVDDLIGRSFKIENPNVVASCGCGTSFSL